MEGRAEAGNRISQLDVVDIAQPLTQRAVEWVYGYDWLDRLESVKKREATTVAGLALEPLQLTSMYQYDAADNRIEFKVPNLQQPALTETFTYSYDDADNILSISKAVGTGSASEIETFTSDDDGNMKTRTSGGVTTTYTWNDFNRLAAISTSDNSKKQSHTFGVNGFRRKKKDKNDVETTEYAAGLATAVSKAQAGDTITYLMDHRLMGFERQSDGAMFWFVTDSLSTVRDVVDSSGEVKARYEFSEYGQRIASTENGVSSQKTFVGGLSVQDEVADAGVMMMGHRFYDPSLGRFMNRDPIGFKGGSNLFEYTKGRPVSLVDAKGLAPGNGDVNESFPTGTNPDPTQTILIKEQLRWLVATNPALAEFSQEFLAGLDSVPFEYGKGAPGSFGNAPVGEEYIQINSSMPFSAQVSVAFHETLHKLKKCQPDSVRHDGGPQSGPLWASEFMGRKIWSHVWIYIQQSRLMPADPSWDYDMYMMVRYLNFKDANSPYSDTDRAYLERLANYLYWDYHMTVDPDR